ncbi:MAG: glycosyltransferase family 4 protein [Chloroflexi bacterium]|nr:glycosyltransferase family 4 protein [Chloroflexota bacterium]
MRIALVHDYLNQYGGAERVLEVLAEIFPGAPVFTSLYVPDRMSNAIRGLDVRVTPLDRLPGARARHQAALLLYPPAFEALDLSYFDLIVSNSSAFAGAAIVRPDAAHLCYCLTPMRWVWDLDSYLAREGRGGAFRAMLRPVVDQMAEWDAVASSRVDRYLAISRTIADRIRRRYDRCSKVIFPPVDVDRLRGALGTSDAPHGLASAEPYYLVLSRLVPYKRIDLAIEACNRHRLRLIVAGSGRDEARLRGLAGSTIEFVGQVTDGQAARLLAGCEALLFPGEEDFGITPLEANALGRPVIAFGAGGACDTVVEGVTGRLFPEPTADSLGQAIVALRADTIDPDSVRAHAERFRTSRFKEQFLTEVDDLLRARRLSRPGRLRL